MSDLRFIACAVDDDDLIAIREFCDFDSDEMKWTEKEREAYAAFKTAPELILPRFVPRDELPSEVDRKRFKDGFIDANVHRAFGSLFCLKEGDSLFFRLSRFPFCSQNNFNNNCKLLSGDTSPMQVLFYALGYSEASRLPGSFGNMIILREDLDSVLSTVKDIMATLNVESWERARRVISVCSMGSVSLEFDQEITEIFSVLPQGIEQARAAGKNFLGFGFWLG